MKTALVLSGGGARSAYEAGVISFLRDELEPRLARPVHFELLCGTSAGALTACAITATATTPERQAAVLAEVWAGFALSEVLSFGPGDLARTAWELGGGGLANPRGLRALVRRLDWRAINRNVNSGLVEVLSVCATRVSDGRSVLFVHQRAPMAPAENPQFELQPTHIGPRHALASAAMPLLFAPVNIHGALYLDGGLRMNVPLSPAVRLGAQRVAVVSLQPEANVAPTVQPPLPSAAFLAGKAMNALLQDRLEQDVVTLQHLNAILECGFQTYGRGFGPTINQALASHRTAPLRYVRNLVARPSRNLGELAHDVVRRPAFLRRNPNLPGLVVAMLAGTEAGNSADLTAYLLFDREFTGELIALGRADARRHEGEWARFFDDTPLCDAEAAELERPQAALTG